MEQIQIIKDSECPLNQSYKNFKEKIVNLGKNNENPCCFN